MFEKIIQKGTLTTVIALIVCVLGVVAALRIPVQMIPDLDVRAISVRTSWPGATPQDVEKEILIEQEDYLRNLPNLSRIIATARSGVAEIELEFPLGTNITEMLIRVNNALSQVPSYPENVDEPRIFANSFSSNSFMFFSVMPLPGNPRQLDMDLTLDFIEDNVKPRMAGVPGMQMLLIADDVRYVEESVHNVWQNLILGALLATAVMFLFLHSFRATLVGVMGIPICIIVAFLGLLLAGRTINVISLAGIAFAIGMTLDNSIVVLESIELERRRGADRLRAALEGVRQVWPAVLASTLTTVLVFIPVAFVEQEAGQLYSDIAIAISAAILASMLVAVTVLPTAAARLEFDRTGSGARRPEGRSRRVVLDLVNRLLATTASRLGCIAVTVVVSGAVIWLLTPAAEYLPEGEEPKVFAMMNAPPGYNLATMSAIAVEVEDFLLPHLQSDPALFRRGEADVPAIAYFNMRVTSGQIRVIAETTDPGDIEALMDALTRKYNEYPGMRAFAARGSIITSNDGGTRSINLDIAGPDLADLYRVALAFYRRAGEVFDNPRIQSQPSSLTLAQLPVYTRAGEVLPLGALVEISETVDTSSVRRVNGRRTVTLNIIPPRSIPLETGVARVREDVVQYLRERGEIPAGGIVGLWLLNGVGSLLPLVGLNRIVQPFDMISMLGFLILMGTVVNNPILIVHRAVQNVKDGAMAPLVLLPGAGTELYRGVGAIVMFGILGAALVTLTMLPALTVIVLQLQQSRQGPA